jgi:hypothetical protein
MDSGVELGWNPQDGQYSAFLKSSPDSSVWCATDYTIQSDDVFQLLVDGRVTWASTLLRTELFYVDGTGQRVVLGSQDNPLNVDFSYTEYSLVAAADANAAGYKLRVLLQNVTPLNSSWAGVDNVRIYNMTRMVTGVARQQVEPTKFALTQNYPNPFNPTTTISYSLKSTGNVSLKVYDILGKEVAVLAEGVQNAGNHDVRFFASNLASGVYFYRLVSPAGTLVKKMMLMK